MIKNPTIKQIDGRTIPNRVDKGRPNTIMLEALKIPSSHKRS